QCDDKQRGYHALRKSQEQRRHQIAAVFSVVGAFRRDDAADIALAERLSSAFAGLRRMSVGEPIHDLRAEARNDAHPNADKAAAHNEPPFAQSIFGAVEETAFQWHRLLLDAEFGERQIERRRNAEHRQRNDADGDSVEQIWDVEDKAHDAALCLLSYRSEQKTEGRGDESFHRTP